MIATFQLGVDITQRAGSNDLSGFHPVGIPRIHNYFLAENLVVLLHEFGFINDLIFQETGISGVLNQNLAHHLVYNDFKMLVIDFHTLHAVHILHFVHDVFLYGNRSLDIQDIGRRDGSVRKGRSGTHIVVFLYQNLFGQRYQVFLDFTGFGSHGNLTISALDFSIGDFSVDFRHYGRVGWVTRFEQLGYTRETSGDIPGFTDSSRNFYNRATGGDFIPFLDYDVGAYGQVVAFNHFSLGIHDSQCGRFGPVTEFGDDFFAETCGFIGFFFVGFSFH